MGIVVSFFYFILDIFKLFFAALFEAFYGMAKGYDWKKWAYSYVPHHVNDRTLIAFLSLLSVHGINKKLSIDNHEKNVIGWKKYTEDHNSDTYIEAQEDMEKLYYGKYTADYNCCEVISVYNAILSLENGNIMRSFPDLLSDFERSGICAKGAFGTSPKSLLTYLKKRHYDALMLSGKSITKKALAHMENKYKAFILMAYNNKNDIGDAIHTVAITIEEQGNYVVHNANGDTVFASLENAVYNMNYGKGRPICIIGVSSRLSDTTICKKP